MTSVGGRRRRGDDDRDTSVALLVARARAAAGQPVDPAVIARTGARRSVELAVELGAPLAPVLDRIGDTVREREELAAAVRRASAEARSVATGLVVGPPVLGLATAGLVSDDPLTAFATPLGRALLLAALALWSLGVLLVALTIRRAGRTPPADDEWAMRAATAVRAGEALPAALRRAAPHDSSPSSHSGADPRVLALWLELGARGDLPTGWDVAGPPLAVAAAAGVGVAGILDELGAIARRTARDAALERAARLGAQLSVPTALLLLPAALLLAAGPLLINVLEGLS